MSTAIPLPDPLGPHDGRRDLDRAIAELAERLPEAMQPLAALAGRSLVRPLEAYLAIVSWR